MTSLRPQFTPLPCDGCPSTCPALRNDELTFVPLITCSADFPLEVFEKATEQLISHPEYNSTLILRSESLSTVTSDFTPNTISVRSHHPVVAIHRKLLPRRPLRDPSVEQLCTLYAESEHGESSSDDSITPPSVLVLTPIVTGDSPLPYYHPAVSHLAFRYIAASPLSDDVPMLRIEVAPLPGTTTDLNSRLYRTCLALLDTLHRYGWGALTNYQKRVAHDQLVPREVYQDLYLVMRERHKHLVDTWQEVTDPLKHVFEDIGIATYLMLLWKDTFAASTGQTVPADSGSAEFDPQQDEPEWKSWPRPPGGFLDLGCGNGLLTHILASEGYAGHGIDLRARTSWSAYPTSTQSRLHVHALDPTSPNLFATSPVDPASVEFLPPGAFIIANHADELTPWTPVLATRAHASGYLSIPCCPWAFDARFARSATPPLAPPPGAAADVNLNATLNLGADAGAGEVSAYTAYRMWLARLSAHCGWQVECEVLRIPSTRNWAIVGRNRLDVGGDAPAGWAEENAEEIVNAVRQRGVFVTRKPEGKAGVGH